MNHVFHSQCYYLGGLETSATGILGEMSKPLSWSMPPLKVCEKLKKLDAQVCDLRFGTYFFPAYQNINEENSLSFGKQTNVVLV